MPSTPMHYYIPNGNKVAQKNRGDFQIYLKKQLLHCGADHPIAWVSAAMATAESGDPYDGDPDSAEAFSIVKDLLKDSDQLAKEYQKQLEGRAPTVTKAEKEQKALNRAQEAAVALREETLITSTSRLQAIVGGNFDVMTNGGLVPKAGAKMTKEEGYTLVSSLTTLAKAGEQLTGLTSLALGDAIMYIEDKFENDLDYTQVMEDTGKSMSLIQAARMISRQFPALKRQEIDPDGNLGFSHWQEIAGRSKIKAPAKEQLAKMVAEKGTPSQVLRELCRCVSELPEEDQAAVVKKLAREVSSSDAAVQVTKKFLEGRGLPTGDTASYLYIKGEELLCSNALNNDLLKEGYIAVKMGTKPRVTSDGLAYAPIAFTRTAPDTLVPDEPKKKAVEVPVVPVVTSEEEGEEEREGEDPDYDIDEFSEEAEPVGVILEMDELPVVYGDFRLAYEENDEGKMQWIATGTLDGTAKKMGLPSNTVGKRDAINKLERHWQLTLVDEDYRTPDGKLFIIRSED